MMFIILVDRLPSQIHHHRGVVPIFVLGGESHHDRTAILLGGGDCPDPRRGRRLGFYVRGNLSGRLEIVPREGEFGEDNEVELLRREGDEQGRGTSDVGDYGAEDGGCLYDCDAHLREVAEEAEEAGRSCDGQHGCEGKKVRRDGDFTVSILNQG